IVIHLLEIGIWALFFWWQNCMPDIVTSFYFSGVTYITVGYGDLILPKEWRLFGPLEGLTGILMCGLSTAFYVGVVVRKVLQRPMPESSFERSSKRVLDPIDRVSEVLFGLIMVLTFTGSLSVAEAGRESIRTMLIGALGCNLAWGIIDGVFYLMGCLAEKGR